MELIKDLKVEPFLRTIWVSEEARKVWEPAIHAISSMVNNLEIDSVGYGHRKCSWQTIPMKSLPSFSKQMGEKGLMVMPVRLVGNWGNGFIHYTPEPKPDDPNPNVYCIISKSIHDAMGFRAGHESGDHEAQGHYLGFPKCCTKAFSKWWGQGYFDPMYQSYENGEGKTHPYSIPILRYIGVRAGFHIPCSFSCVDTINIGIQRMAIAQDRELVKLFDAMLSMPMSWEVYHGVAIVKTPIFYVLTQSLPTKEKYRIKIDGKFVPRESATGVNFPFKKGDSNEKIY